MDKDSTIIERKYVVPGSRVVLYLLLAVMYLLILLSLFVLPFVLGRGDFVGIILFALAFAWAVSFFVLLQRWMDVLSYPVSTWVLEEARCPGCGERFKKCMYAFRNTSFLGFGLWCPRCRTCHLAASGMFDRTLKLSSFPVDSELEADPNLKLLKKKLSE